mgnify:CR=1 FL=1
MNSSITNLGSVKYNAQRDVLDTHRRKKRFKGSPDDVRTFTMDNVSKQDDEFTIMPRELCLRWKTPKTKKRMYTDTDVNVFSSANGLFLSSADHPDTLSQMNDVEKLAFLRSQLDFGGIAVTRAVYSSTEREDEQVVVLFGGSTTIRNTGHAHIRSGDFVQWDLPLDPKHEVRCPPRSSECRSTKLLFQTNPFNPSDCDLTAEELADYESKRSSDERIQCLNGFLRSKYYEARRRVFGRALSSAAPGKEFDVLLGRYMA